MITMHNVRQEQLSWSILDPKPNFYIHVPSNSHICYWQGIAMTRNQALMILLCQWNQAWPSPDVKKVEWANFRRAYAMGAFGGVHWRLEDFNETSHFNRLIAWVQRDNSNLLTQLGESYSFQQALEWLLDEAEIND